MKKVICIVLLSLFTGNVFSQVGIGTTNPSSAAVLHLKTSNLGAVKIGGFLLPVVTEVQQALIPVKSSDDGLMVFVKDEITGKWCLEIYDSKQKVWRSIQCA
jgi:hypothetical protein